MSQPKIFVIEGNIGSGKSTFLKRLGEKIPNSQIILEPVEEWQNIKDENGKNVLDYFYTDMKRWCYLFQSMAFITRFNKMKLIDNTKEYIFIERSIFSDRRIFAENCYQQGLMSEIEWKTYLNWHDTMKNLITHKMNFIYLKCDSEISFQRLKERNRDEENKVTLEYLKDLEKRHNEWLEDSSLILDASVDFKNSDVELDELIKKIISYE